MHSGLVKHAHGRPAPLACLEWLATIQERKPDPQPHLPSSVTSAPNIHNCKHATHQAGRSTLHVDGNMAWWYNKQWLHAACRAHEQCLAHTQAGMP